MTYSSDAVWERPLQQSCGAAFAKAGLTRPDPEKFNNKFFNIAGPDWCPMTRRHQIEAIVCAGLFLASIFVIAVTLLGRERAPVKWTTGRERPPSQPMRANHSNISSIAKVPSVQTPQLARSPALEILSPSDEGALWDEGPAYDLSH